MVDIQEGATDLRVVTSRAEFSRSFPVGDSIRGADQELRVRFHAVGQMKNAIDRMARHGPKAKEPTFGLLDINFDLTNVGGTGPRRRIPLVPMGANNYALVGCFGLSGLVTNGNRPRQGDRLSLFGTAMDVGESAMGYAMLDRRTLEAGGFGIMQYAGRIAVFSELPDDSSLIDVVRESLDSPKGFHGMQLARPDQLVQPTQAYAESTL